MISLLVIPSLIGAGFVAMNKANAANLIWAVSNVFMIYYNYMQNDITQVLLFLVYWIISIYGVYRYSKTMQKNKVNILKSTL